MIVRAGHNTEKRVKEWK